MKCVKKGISKVKRVDDKLAASLVDSGHSYCPKWEWKEQEGKPYKGKKDE